jgi:glycosyltransferase involved in cell wall biosynthesis
LSAVKKYDPEVVFLTGYNNLIYYRFIFGWDSVRIPLIFRGDSHRLFARRTPDEFLRHRFISFVFRRFSAFLYVGKSNYDYFCYHNVRPERLFFSPHAVDNERFLGQAVKANEDAFAWKKEAGIPPDYRVILYVGKFEEKKRLFDLLEAFRMADLSKVALLCVGSGEMEAALRECSRGVGDVYFAPFQNQTFMPRTYAAGDLFVLPSYGREETWGLSVNEAMCMAKAVIVSSHVGCAQDLVVPRKNGLVFPAGDVEALAHCLREAFSDSVDLVRWGLEGQKMIEHYHYVEATKGLVQALDFLARERGN